MEDIRPYRMDQEDDWQLPDDERESFVAAPEDEVPYHIPRD
jgi:hypothetical protein